jgi:hypothetical protein
MVLFQVWLVPARKARLVWGKLTSFRSRLEIRLAVPRQRCEIGAALLLPALSAGKARAHQIVFMSNVKQLQHIRVTANPSTLHMAYPSTAKNCPVAAPSLNFLTREYSSEW